MFHRITLEASKLKDARLVKLDSRSKRKGDDGDRRLNRTHYEELSFKKDAHVFFRGFKLPLSFVSYLLVGTIFYHFDPGNGANEDHPNAVLGFYEAITIGYSVGLSPKNPAYIPNPWFSSVYILIGAGLIALNLVVIGRKIEEKASNVVFDGLKRREDYEMDMSRDNPFCMRFVAFVKYNAPYLIIILLWLLWLAFIIIWSIIATNTFDENDPEKNWGFAYAQYFAVSLCSSAGSFSLPSNSENWAYGFAAVSMMIGVPLMALAISSIVIMLSQGHQFKKVKKAAWDPVELNEIEALKQLGLCEGDGDVINKGGFVLLGLLRMGQDSGIIQYLADAYDASDERGGVLMSSSLRSDDDYSRHARAYLNRADSDSNENVSKKTTLSKADRQWSVAALKDQHSGRIERSALETLSERLLEEDEAPLDKATSYRDVVDEM